MLFNEKLKKIRKESSLTQEQLAEKLNVSRQAITKWESGDGVPDIENLKQISKLFNITIDELVKEEKNVQIEGEKGNSYIKELEIDHTKHFDINICKIEEVNFIRNDEEKVKVELLSDKNDNLENSFKIIFDNHYNKMDIDITNNEKKSDTTVNIYLPQKYIDDIEINTKVKTMNIENLEIEKIEFDGALKYMNVKKFKGSIVLNTSKCDVEAFYDKFEGNLEVNIINSTARVQIPKETKYKTILKGMKNKFINEKSVDDANNTIELNGINSKMIIIEK